MLPHTRRVGRLEHAEMDSVTQPEVESEWQEGSATEQRGGQENRAQEQWDHREVGMVRSERDEAPASSAQSSQEQL